MRLLRVISSLDPRGGGPIEGARQIDAVLVERGVEVEVLCLDAPDAGDFLRSYPATVHPLGPTRGGYRYSSILAAWLRENTWRFDAVVVNGLWQYHGFATWRVLGGTDTPYFVFTHGMLDPWFKRAYPFKHLKKWLYWPWAEYRLLRDARAVLFTSEGERRLARQSFWLYRCNEVVTSYGTAPPPIYENARSKRFTDKYPDLRGKRILLFLSRIHEKKGCDLLIKAFERIAGVDESLHLVMAGPDQAGWQVVMKRLAESLNIAHRISWLGMLQGDDKWDVFHAAEVFCLPSHQENFGIVVAEALGCAKPVLISNKVNIWREVESDKAGIVHDDTVDGLVNALESWLDLAPCEQAKMRRAAKRCFDNRFRIEQVADDLIDIISLHLASAKQP